MWLGFHIFLSLILIQSNVKSYTDVFVFLNAMVYLYLHLLKTLRILQSSFTSHTVLLCTLTSRSSFSADSISKWSSMFSFTCKKVYAFYTPTLHHTSNLHILNHSHITSSSILTYYWPTPAPNSSSEPLLFFPYPTISFLPVLSSFLHYLSLVHWMTKTSHGDLN